MRETRLKPIGVNMFRIWLQRMPDGRLCGRADGGTLNAAVEFSSLSRLILLLDTAMDTDPGLIPAKLPAGPEPTILLEVLFRQNYSWQGRITWLKEGKEATFRSVLELIVLLETLFGK